MKDFSGKIAFITGGASGAGFGQALVFGEAGCKVMIADIRRAALDEAVASLRNKGIDADTVELDVTDRDAFVRAADATEARFGRAPHLLFNTAGVNSFGPVERSTYGDFDWLVGVNLGGVINGMVTFVPRMIAAGSPGHIVSVSSAGGFLASPVAAPYSAAKAAVINLMESYAASLARYGIGVSVVCPANIRSNIAEATRLRPSGAGASGYAADEDMIASLHTIHAEGMDPVELARHTKTGIEEGALHIIPYPELADDLRKRFDSIVAAVLPMDRDPEGAKRRVEALAAWVVERSRLASAKPSAS